MAHLILMCMLSPSLHETFTSDWTSVKKYSIVCVHPSGSVSAWNENKAKKSHWGQLHMHYWSMLLIFLLTIMSEISRAFGCVTIDRREESLFTCACYQRKLVGFWTVPARKHSIEKLFSAWKCAKCHLDVIGTQRLYCFSRTERLLSLSLKCCWRI